MHYPQFAASFLDLLKGLKGKRVVVIGHQRPDGDCIGSQVALCRVLRSQKIDAICVNPDITMIREGQFVPAPGAIAKIYENLGGTVEYVGKPHSAFFHHALTAAATGADARAVMIGDSPEHDVCGAKAMGFSTLLVRTGIHQSLAEPRLLSLCAACGGTPDFLAAAFEW